MSIDSIMEGITGLIMRHGPDHETRTFVSMATCLGNGIWATIGSNVYGGEVYGKERVHDELIDLYIHPLGTGRSYPVEWGYNGVLKPLALLYSSGTEPIEPIDNISAAELAFPEYEKIWRHSLGGWSAFADMEFDYTKETKAVEGTILGKPSNAKFSNEEVAHSLVVLADMKYPGKKNGGSPILGDDGRLAGMLIGPDFSPGGKHGGYYMPIDYITPSFEMAKVSSREENRKGRPYIDWATHLSSNIYY